MICTVTKDRWITSYFSDQYIWIIRFAIWRCLHNAMIIRYIISATADLTCLYYVRNGTDTYLYMQTEDRHMMPTLQHNIVCMVSFRIVLPNRATLSEHWCMHCFVVIIWKLPIKLDQDITIQHPLNFLRILATEV